MTPDGQKNAHYLRGLIIDLAVKLDWTGGDKEERDYLIELLLRDAANNQDDDTQIFIQSAINYIRFTGGATS